MDIVAVLCESVRRKGLTVQIEDEWEIDADVVATSSRDRKEIYVNPASSEWAKAFAIMAIATGSASFWPGSCLRYPAVYASECYVDEAHCGVFLARGFEDFLAYMEAVEELYPDIVTGEGA